MSSKASRRTSSPLPLSIRPVFTTTSASRGIPSLCRSSRRSAIGRREEPHRVDAVRDLRHLLGRDAGRDEFVPDQGRHRDKRIRPPQDEVPQPGCPPHQGVGTSSGQARSPRVDLAGELPVDLGLEHDRLAQRSAGEQSDRTQDPGPADDHDVEPMAFARERGSGKGRHQVLARSAESRRQHPQDADPI